MSTIEQTTYQRIKNYVQMISRSPRRDVKYFYIEKDDRFIVEGDRIKLLPLKYNKYYNKDMFCLHINVSEKKIMFYAYNINNYIDNKRIDEEEGYMDWDDTMEKCIYQFLVVNIKELTTASYPHIDAVSPTSRTDYTNPTSSKTERSVSGTNWESYANNHNRGSYSNDYTSPSYREREDFYDKIFAFQKQGRTTSAIDLITEYTTKLCTEKKFDDLDTFLRLISMDRLSTATMLGILNATKSFDRISKERKFFFEKVKNHITKIKPSRVGMVLGNLEPGKEYQGIVFYQKEEKQVETKVN